MDDKTKQHGGKREGAGRPLGSKSKMKKKKKKK